MGFFSSILGGSKGKSSGSSGFGALPKEAQQAYIDMTKQGANLLLGQKGANVFTPLPQTAQETQAFNLMQLPTTQEGVSSLTNMYLNPFQNYLTDEINRQAMGDFSLYKQSLSDAGQMGSNREFLNSAAADQARMNAIGQSLASNYNTALSTGLNQNQQNIANLLAQGGFARDLNAQGNQSELQALQALGALLGTYPQSSNEASKSSSSNGIGGLLSGAGSLLGFFSDARLKENIEYIGNKNGYNVYSYNYKGDDKKYTGVLAQEVEKSSPEAVSEVNGFKFVDYSKLGFKPEQLNG